MGGVAKKGIGEFLLIFLSMFYNLFSTVIDFWDYTDLKIIKVFL